MDIHMTSSARTDTDAGTLSARLNMTTRITPTRQVAMLVVR